MSQTRTMLAAVFAIVALAIAGPAASIVGAAEVPAQASTAGCGRTPPASGARTITVGGVSRSYILDVPSGYRRDTPAPIVFGLHGLGGNGGNFKAYAGLGDAMGADSILVYPSATGPYRAWHNDDDTLFFDAMLTQVGGLLCVNQGRVFTVGHSMGAIFSNHLGCVRGDVIRAIAPVAGAGPVDGLTCVGQVAVWLAHGNPDRTVAYSQGVASRDFWLGENTCTTSTRPVGRGVEYQDCDAGHEVRWFPHTEGHAFPGFAAGEIASFFTSRK